MWKILWQKMIDEAAALNAQSGFPLLNEAKAFSSVMQNVTVSKDDAISALNTAIAEISSFTEKIKAIPGSSRDLEIQSQIALNSKYITRYLNEINLYKGSTDEKFRENFPSSNFRGIAYALNGLKRACDFFVARGPRFNPI